MNITVRQMEIFSEIVKKSSVSIAANKLMISQAAASIALAELEKQIGYPLFNRHGKKLELNISGKKLFPLICEILSKIDKLEKLANDNVLTGELKIGAKLNYR